MKNFLSGKLKSTAGKQRVCLVLLFILLNLSALILAPLFPSGGLSLDWLFKARHFFRGNEEVSPAMVLFSLDDAFENKHKVNRLERGHFARGLTSLVEAGARSILFDIIFRFKTDPGNDSLLVREAETSGKVILPVVLERREKREADSRVTDKSVIYPRVKGKRDLLPYTDMIHPFPELTLNARGLGGISRTPEDKIYRIPLIYPFENGWVPSLVLAGVCHYYGVDPGNMEVHFGRHIRLPGGEHTGGEDILIPIDKRGLFIVNYTGPMKDSVKSYSFGNFYLPVELLGAGVEDSLVLVADRTNAGKDFSRGIFDAVYPNSLILANAINTILTGNFLRPPGMGGNLVFFLLASGLLITFLLICKKIKRTMQLIAELLFSLLLVFFFCLYLFSLLTFFKEIPNIFFCGVSLVIILSTAITARRMFYAPTWKAVAKQKAGTPLYTDPGDYLSDNYNLTPREMKIALSILEGKLQKEIAEEESISEALVRKKVKSIYDKCGVRKNMELAARVYSALSPPLREVNNDSTNSQ